MYARLLKDLHRHKGLRKRLVEEIRAKGITNEKVLEAISNIPRHYFMDQAFVEYAYQDKAFPISCEQTISQPFTVAYQTQFLDVVPGMKVLEIGTGSGYQAAVLCEMGVRLYSIERHKALSDQAKSLLQYMGYSPKLVFGDGFAGLPLYAPFDRIIVTCGAGYIPENLFSQLKPGGWMLIPLGPENEQVMTIVLKNNDGNREIIELEKFKFVPMLQNKSFR
ncbi:MAG TPA: protein-L-isoaspartate(D-aspartate) O-methyltransferase [Bacteroidia bacterium]|nr:protein-L-isoaspartate(D-aspartate) O-methyltransferase [Bacteroidia bacterium]